MILEAMLEQSLVEALGTAIGDSSGVQIVGSRLETKVEQGDKLTVVAVASGFRTHDAFSLSLVNVPVAISIVSRVEGDATSEAHNQTVEKIVDVLVDWHKNGKKMEQVLSSRKFLAGELRMDGGTTQVLDKDRRLWRDVLNITLRGSERFYDPEKSYLFFGNADVQVFDWTGEINRDSMVAAGLYDNQEQTWLKDITFASFGSKVTSLGFAVLDLNPTVRGVEIPDTVTSIGDFAFGECSNLEGDIVIPDATTSIGVQAFTSCEKLTGITVGSGVESIGNLAFLGCTSLTNVTFKGKTLEQVQGMTEYPWGITDTSIIHGTDI